MSVISIETAIEHLRAEDDDRAFIQGLLDAAELAAASFLQRNIYPDEESLLAARGTVALMRRAARARQSAGLELAGLIEDLDDRDAAVNDSEALLREDMEQADAIARGMVLNRAVQAACLLTLGHLYTNREDVVAGSGTLTALALPKGSRFLLDPYRVKMGV